MRHFHWPNFEVTLRRTEGHLIPHALGCRFLTFLLSRSQWEHIFSRFVIDKELFSTFSDGATACLISSLRRKSLVIFKIKNLFLMAVFPRLCSLRHWAKCSTVSCCSPVAEYRPTSLVHSVNKSGLVWLTCAATIRRSKTALPPANGDQTNTWGRG